MGKSSLLNALSGSERAIVTDIPGTTRDTVEEYINIGGLALKISDTAGIRESTDVVERIGIERARNSIKEADLALFVMDSSVELTEDDFEIAKLLTDKNCIVILNKQDKTAVVTADIIENQLGISQENILPLALPKNGEKTGLKELENAIAIRFAAENIDGSEIYISSRRHRDCLVRAKAAMDRLTAGLCANMPKDLLYIDLEEAAQSLGEITGETVQEEIVNQVFEKFCVGK